jgi:hypothetical protein
VAFAAVLATSGSRGEALVSVVEVTSEVVFKLVCKVVLASNTTCACHMPAFHMYAPSVQAFYVLWSTPVGVASALTTVIWAACDLSRLFKVRICETGLLAFQALSDNIAT